MYTLYVIIAAMITISSGNTRVNTLLYFQTYRDIGMLLEGSLALPLSEVMKFVPNPCAAADVMRQLVKSFPILAVSKGRHVVLINCHELIMTDDGFDKLLLLDKPTPTHTRRVETSPSPTASGTCNEIGRPSLVSQFSEIVSTTTSFIKANGYSAHEHR